MRMVSKPLLAPLAAAAFAFTVTSAGAATTYDFGTLLSGAPAPASLSFATLSAEEVGADVKFTLDAFGLDGFSGSAPFIGVMAVDGVDTGSVADVSGGVATVARANGGGPGGSFEFRFDFGKGSDRLTDNETVSWTWVGGAGNYDNFALHVQGLDYEGANSAWYTPAPAIPEPETYALMLAGLGAVGFMARRRRLG